jgi:MFS family permease
MRSTSEEADVRAGTLTGAISIDDTVTPLPLLIMAAGLLIAVAVIHLQDQGGLLGDQSPTWLEYGYYVVEIVSIISALFLVRGKAVGWVLGLGSTVGPFIGYVLSRSVGLPGDSGDVGNWGYLLGTVSLLVEGTFILLALICLTRLYSRRCANVAPRHRAADYDHRASQPA